MFVSDRFRSEGLTGVVPCARTPRGGSRWLARKSVATLEALAVVLVASQLIGQAAESRQHSRSSPSIVGFWAGEDAALPQGQKKPTSPETYYDPAYRGDLTPEVWRVLADYHVPLYLNVRYGRDFGPVPRNVHSDVVALVRKANSLGVPIIAWIVIPYEQGYWAYQGNAQAMSAAVKAWAEWRKANHLRFASLAIDQEFSWQNLQTYIAIVTSHDPEKLSSWMRTNIDPSAQCSAFHAYKELISWVHLHGIAVEAAEAPMVADDLADSKLALQNALQITGSSPGYDQMYLMAYRSAVAQAGFDPGPAYPASYYASMQKYFGAVGQVSLGIPGQAPYNTLSPLVNDVRMLVGLGATEIPIYSLEEMVTAFGAAGIKEVAEAAKHPMQGSELAEAIKPSPATAGMMGMSKSQDATAVELTVSVTKEKGHPQQPNSWPDGCGSLSVHALVNPHD
jgi:hypothetical protein